VSTVIYMMNDELKRSLSKPFFFLSLKEEEKKEQVT